jgi:hypothetical protein
VAPPGELVEAAERYEHAWRVSTAHSEAYGVWLYPGERWSDGQFRLGPQHDALRQAIGSELDQLRSGA